MSGINLVGGECNAFYGFTSRPSAVKSASPVTIPFKAPSFFIRLYKISTCFCIEMNTARNINKGISLRRIQFGSEVPSETGYSHIASAFRAVNFADTVNVEKHRQDVGAVVAEHQSIVISIQIKYCSVFHKITLLKPLLMQYLIFRLATVTRVMLLQLSKRRKACYFQNDLIICFATP